MNPNRSNFVFPATGIALDGAALLLAIDDVTFPIRQHVCLDLTKPTVRKEAVLEPAERDTASPDNLAAHFYGTVLHDGGRFRMWYYACHWGRNPDWPPAGAEQLAKWKLPLFQGPLCYAESDDGIHWTKPNLNQVLFKGSRANNAMQLPHTLVSCATVVKDDADPDGDRRYKMAYEFFPEFSEPPIPGVNHWMPTCALAVSRNGIEWKVTEIPFPNEFIEQSSFYQHDGKFIINSQQIEMQEPGEGGTPRGRQGFARMTYDFDLWPTGAIESFILPEPQDVEKRGINGQYDQVHLGVGAVSFGSVCVGLFGLWHNANFNDSFSAISCDFGLVISNDGLHFREPVKGHRFLTGADSPAPAVPGKQYHTNLCQANGILNVGDETRIYHGRWRNSGSKPGDIEHYRGEVALATLPRDRWGALRLSPHQESGCVWTAPVTLPDNGCKIFLNADGGRGMGVELSDEKFIPLADYSGANSGTVTTDNGFDCPVNWPGPDLSALGGMTLRLKINLKTDGQLSPRLYAITLRAEA